MRKIKLFIGAFLGATILLSSCDEDLLNNQPTQEDVELVSKSVVKNGQAEMGAVKVFENINNYGISEEGGGKKSFLVGEPTRAWNGNTLTLTFTDGGKLIAAFNDKPAGYKKGLKADVTFKDYKHKDVYIKGGNLSIEITDITMEGDSITKIIFAIKSTGYLSMSEDNNTFEWSVDQTLSWIGGIQLVNNVSEDDTYLLDGSSKLKETIDNNLVETEVLINESLEFKPECEYIQEGKMTTTQTTNGDNKIEVICNFSYSKGDACDSWIQLTAGFITFNLDLSVQ